MALVSASLLLLAIFSSALAGPLTKNSTFREKEEWKEDGSRKWVSAIMSQILPDFTVSSSINPECSKQGLLYKKHLANLTLWAVQMLDASSLAEIGLVSGNEYNSGNFDQCIRLKVPEYNISGKHCLAHMKIKPTYYDIEQPYGIHEYKNISPMSSVWDKIRRVTDDRIKKRDRFYWALCIPAACSHLDLQQSLAHALRPAFTQNGISIQLDIQEIDCTVEDDLSQLTTGSYIYLLFVLTVVLIIVSATIVHTCFYESYLNEKEDSSVLLMLSMISNSKKLFRPEAKQEFQFLSGMKVLSMFMIIYGHRMLMSMYWPLFNVEDQEMMFDTFLEIINLNGPIIVNTFLLTTGFLIFNKVLTDIRKGRKINVPLYIFYRWARTTPVYAFILCSFIFLKPLNTNEPLYKREALWRHETCSQNFWSYILYVNNYYKPNTECLLPAWYLAVDMQLYIICVITGYIMSMSTKCGYILLGFLAGASVAIPGVVTYYQGYDATLRFYINFLQKYYEKTEYVESYIPTHMRAAPFVVGMLTALILMKLKKRNYRFNVFQRVVGITTAITLGVGSLLYAWIFYIPGRYTSFLENGIYVSVHRLTWSICISWIILAGVLNGYGKVSFVLNSSFYVPLNKLMLNALLVHTLVQGQTFLAQRSPEYVNLFTILWKTGGDLVLTYIISYFLHVFLEAPLARLQDLALRKFVLRSK